MNTKDEKLTIADFSVEKLAELSGKKDEQLKLVDENPFIEISDPKSLDEANKRRTALRTGRTSLEKEEKEVINKIKKVISDPVKEAYKNLIAITTPHEEKQQNEIDRYKTAKEAEKAAEAKKERERIDNIKNQISAFVHKNKVEIENLKYEDSLTFEIPTLDINFQEFKSIYISETEGLKFLLNNRKDFLAKEEKNRIDAIEIKKQQDEANRIQNIRNLIWDYSQNWIKKINNSTKETINQVEKEFLEQGVSNYAEFQIEFEVKKNEVSQLIDQRKKQIIQQIEYDKQQAEILEFKRRKEISSLGFDFNSLIFEKNGNRIQLNLQDILGTEEGFQNIINHTKIQIENFDKPKIETPVLTSTNINSQQKHEMQSPINTTSFQAQKQSKPLSANQKKSIEFISNFVSYANGQTMTIDLITKYVLSKIK